MNTAAKVREAKEKNPENFCRNPRCLWRTVTRDGFKPCPKHRLQRDLAGRTCPDCVEQLGEIIPLDTNGTCHGCGSCFGKADQQLSER